MTKLFNQKSQTPRRKLLRRNLSDAEVALWLELKTKKMDGYKFRRQYSIGRYVIDFYCPILKLAIEVDGDSHSGIIAREYDKKREAFIKSFGIRFLRFKNQDIENGLQQVLDKILYACKK